MTMTTTLPQADEHGIIDCRDYDTPAVHAITIRHLPTTNTKPTRVKLTSMVFEGDHLTYTRDLDGSLCGSTLDQGLYHLKRLGFTILGVSESDGDHVVFVKERTDLNAAPLTAKVPFDPPMLSGIQEPGYEAIDGES